MFLATRLGTRLVIASALVATPAVADDPRSSPDGATPHTGDPGSTPEQVAIEPARPPVPEPLEPVTPDEPTAEDAAAAPRPGNESGRIDEEGGPSIARQVGRTVLFVPRAAIEIAFAPIRGGLWAYDHYRLRDRWMRVFFNDARTIGVYPTLRISSDFGFDVGARFVMRDVFGAREQFTLRGGIGQSGRRNLDGSFRTGELFDRLELTVGGEYERRPDDKFYGIGNRDETEMAPPVLIDPLADSTAVETRYEQELLRGSVIADAHVGSAFHVRAAAAYTDLEFGPGEGGTPIDEVYDPEQIVGFEGTRHAYGELELVWDDRGPASQWEFPAIPSVGTLAFVYAGRAAVFEGGDDFWRVGGQVAQYFRLGVGPRTFIARLHAEAVSGDVDEVPFDELPKLGGATLLRGYPTDRFRDRTAALGTLEYRWDLARFLLATLFVDVGQVAPSLSDVAQDFDDLRIGYGLGFEAYSRNSFVMRASVASSIDGGIFFHVSLDPLFDLDPRVGRR